MWLLELRLREHSLYDRISLPKKGKKMGKAVMSINLSTVVNSRKVGKFTLPLISSLVHHHPIPDCFTCRNLRKTWESALLTGMESMLTLLGHAHPLRIPVLW